MMKNPFLTPYTTPHGTVPFDQITLPDYEPAIREGMRWEDEEIETPLSTTRKNLHSTILSWRWSNREAY